MPKNKWLLVLLSLGLAGTAVYNITFFASRDQGNSPQSTVMPGIVPTAPLEPVQNINAINGTVHFQGSVSSEAQSRPFLSMEEIERQARNPVDLSVKSGPPTRRDWPDRDPFQAARQHVPVLTEHTHSAESSVKPPLETESPPPDPSFKVSATLIEEDRRIALVNGVPKKIGAAVGNWRIVAIEPDYVVVQTPGGERKVEIVNRLAHEKQISNK
jgi:hypothetical protein